MELNVGDKLVCIVDNDKTFAPCEVVEIERVASSGGDTYCMFKGYSNWYNGEEIKELFRIY